MHKSDGFNWLPIQLVCNEVLNRLISNNKNECFGYHSYMKCYEISSNQESFYIGLV